MNGMIDSRVLGSTRWHCNIAECIDITFYDTNLGASTVTLITSPLSTFYFAMSVFHDHFAPTL